jgi:hypothetical protein
VTRVTSQKNEDLIFMEPEVWNLANLKKPAEHKMVLAKKKTLSLENITDLSSEPWIERGKM